MTGPDPKAMSRGISTDMSPEAIARRLEIAAELYELFTVLQRAKGVETGDSVRERDSSYRPRPVGDGPSAPRA